MSLSPLPEHSTSLHSVAIGCDLITAKSAIAPTSTLLQASVMENSEVRLKNLQLLLASERGSQKDFAAKIGTSPNFLNQMLTTHRNVGTQTARRIETRLKLSRGWMDQPRPKEWETMILAAYDERLSKSRAVSRRGISIAARVDSLTDDRAVDVLLDMLDILEERQAVRQGTSSQNAKRPSSE